MPLPLYTEIAKHPEFAALPYEERVKKTESYWNKYDQENPGDKEFSSAQRKQSLTYLDTKERYLEAAPIQQKMLEPVLENDKLNLATLEGIRTGKVTPEQAKRLSEEQKGSREELKSRLTKTNSLFTPEVDAAMQPAWQALEKTARVSGKFGTKTLEGDDVESAKAYAGYRDTLAKDFNLDPADVDDIVKHRLGLQDKPVSRDARGVIHIKDDVLRQGNDAIEKAILDSDLPPGIKSKTAAESAQRATFFKKGVIDSVKKNHPELAAEISLKGDIETDYAAIDDVLQKSRTAQFGGGFAAGGLELLSKFAGREFTEPGDYVSPDQKTPQELKAGADALVKRQQSINQLSHESYQKKVELWGTDAAVIGQGVESVAESVALGAATGGLGNAIISADRINKAGRLGKLALGFAQRSANVAPVAAYFGANQAISTYEQAMESDDPEIRDRAMELAAKSGAIESVITTLFSGVKLGGTEDIGSRLASAAGKESIKKGIGRAVLSFGKDVLGETFEENTIALLDTLAVQAKLNPQLTVDDLKKTLRDTTLSTVLTTAPLGAFSAAVEQKRSKDLPDTFKMTDAQLHDYADALAQAAVAEKEGRTLPEKELPQISRTGLEQGASDRLSELRMKQEGTPGEVDASGKPLFADTAPQELTPSEKEELDLLEKAMPAGGDVDHAALAESYGFRIKEPTKVEDLPETAAPTETLPEGSTSPKGEGEVTPTLEEDVAHAATPVSSLPTGEARSEAITKRRQAANRVVATLKKGDVVVDENGNELTLSSNPVNGKALLDNDPEPTDLEVNFLASQGRDSNDNVVDIAPWTIKPSNQDVQDQNQPAKEASVQVPPLPTGETAQPTEVPSVPSETTEVAKAEVEASLAPESAVAQKAVDPDIASIQPVGKEVIDGRGDKWTKTESGWTLTSKDFAASKGVESTENMSDEIAQRALGKILTNEKESSEIEASLKSEDVAAPTAENALVEIAKLVGVVPEGVAKPAAASKPAAAPKLVQGTLFQDPESKGDPAASKYVLSFKGSPPKGATRVLIDYAGEPLLRDLGDLPAHTVKDIEEADQLIQKAAGKNGKVRVGRVRFNDFLSKLWKRHHRGKKPGWHNFQSRRDIREMGKVLSFEISHALSKDGSGVDWYRAKIDGMYQELSVEYPELAEDGEARFLFSVMLAVTSNGQTVLENLSDTLALYDRIRGTSFLPVEAKTSRSERNAAVRKAFIEVNALLKENGWEQTKADMLAPTTIADLHKKYGIKTTGELVDHKVIGAMILGPKIGSFWGNLNGHYDSITMDLWFTRTMNRLSGDTATLNPDKLAVEFTKLLATPGLPTDVKDDIKKFLKDSGTQKSWVRVPSDIREEVEFLYDYVKTVYSKYTTSGFEDRSDFNKTVQKIVKEIDGGEDTPDNGSHRQWMRSVVEAAQSELRKAGINITNADLQAILWFHEKDLYTRFGATSNRGERTDYTQAAQRLAGTPGGSSARTSRAGRSEDTGAAGQARQEGLGLDVPTETRKQMEARLKAERETLYQDEEGPKGLYRPGVRGAAQATIGFMRSADASTGVHEYWHDLAENDFFGILTPEEVKTIRDWETGGTGERDTAAKEKGARGWERFLFEGTSTGLAEVDAVLSKLSEWLRSIYKGITNSSLNVDISPEVRAIMEKLVTRAARGGEVVITPTKVVRISPAAKPASAAPAPRIKLPAFRRKSLPGPMTSTKNAETDQTLREAGFAPVYEPARKALQETFDEALSLVRHDKDRGTENSLGNRLISSLMAKPRNITDVDHGILLDELAKRKLRQGKAQTALVKASAAGDEHAIATARKALDDARIAVYDAVTAAKLAGTEWGRAGRFRQIRIDEDYTIEAMEARFATEINGGELLNDDQIAIVHRLQKELSEAQAKSAALSEKIEQMIREKEEANIMPRLTEDVVKANVRAPSVEKKPVFKREVDTAAESARERLARRGVIGERLMQNPETLYQSPEIDPEILDDLAIVGVEYLNNDAKDLKTFTARLVDEFGEDFRVHAKTIFEKAQKQFKATASKVRKGRTPEQLLKEVDPDNPELSNKMVFNMARGFITTGLRDKAVLDAVHKALLEKMPDLTREEVSDAFTGYGKVKYPSKEEDLVILRELRNIERIQRQLDDVQAGIAPKKTGQQRDPATLKIRDLQRELKEAMRKAGFKSASRAGQLRGALDAIKSRYRNEIEELNKAISTKARRTDRKTTIEYDDEVKDLKRRRDELKLDYDDMFGVNRKEMSDAQRVKAAVKSLTKRITEEEAMFKAGILERSKSPTKTPLTPELKALRDKLDSLIEARHKAKEALYPKKSPEDRALERALSAVDKSIKRYDAILSSGVLPSGKPAPTFTPSAALNALWSQRNAMRKAVDALRKSQRPRLSPMEKARRQAVAQLDKSIKAIEAKIAAGDLSVKPRTAGLAAGLPDVMALRQQMKDLRAVHEAMKKAAMPVKSEEQRRLDRDKKAIRTRMAKLQARIAAGDFRPTVKVPPAMDAEKIDLMHKEMMLKEEWNRHFFEATLRDRKLSTKALDAVQEVVNVSRAFMTMADVSAVLRQGGFIVLGHPVLGVRNIPTMFRAGFSEKAALGVQSEIQGRSNYAISQLAKLFIAKMGPDVSVTEMEESFRGRWAKKIPGFKYIQNFSERTYVTFLNKLRMDVFDTMAASVTADGHELTIAEAKVIANFINIATGRGNLYKAEVAAGFLATVMFSPKFVASRFQLLGGVVPVAFNAATGFKLTSVDERRAKKAVAVQYARSIAGISAVYMLAALAKAGFGDDDEPTEIDPRSSDFGKIKLGNTRLDLMSGILQAATFGARMATAETKSGGKIQSLRNVGFGKTDYAGVVWRFMRSKSAPAVGTFLNVGSGRDLGGNKVTVASEAVGAFIPLVVDDVYQVMREQGVAKGLPLAVLAAFGAGVQTHNDSLPFEQQQILIRLGANPADFGRGKTSTGRNLKLNLKLKL